MKKRIICIVFAISVVIGIIGCGSTDNVVENEITTEEASNTEENNDDGLNSNAENVDEVKTEADAGAQEDKDEVIVKEDIVDYSALSSEELFDKWIAGEITVKYSKDSDTTISYAEITDPALDWEMFSEVGRDDVDNDDEIELLLSGPYGLMIIDKVEDELLVLDEGDGMAAMCGVAVYNDSWWVLHMDTSHMGRMFYEMTRYEGYGNIVETNELSAEYWDDENDEYDETDDFTFSGQKITMAEFEKIKDELLETLIK